MKTFLKQILSVFLTLALCFLLFVAAATFLYWKYIRVSVPQKSVLHIALNEDLLNVPQNEERERNLLSLVSAIDRARNDIKIQGIYLESGASWNIGWASLEELRSALKRFKKTGKFVVAYGDYYSQKAYYIASCADESILHPSGLFMLKGLSCTRVFYKDLLEQIGVETQVLRIGQYKSAVETYTRSSASPASRHQSAVMVQSFYAHFLKQTAAAKGLTSHQLRTWSENLSSVLPKQAIEHKLFGKLGHPSDAQDHLRERLGVNPDAKLRLISIQKYMSHAVQNKASKSDSIAVLTLCGTIDKNVNTLVEQLQEARQNAAVKAIVLRINSPGGSVTASETLWNEIILTKIHKPVIASMGDVAASGGYYAAAACNKIIAQPNTITGSIGIYGLFFDVNKLLTSKLGITKSVVKTAPSADLFSRKMTSRELSVWYKQLCSSYEDFLERVSQGRKLTLAQVNVLAQGRVWPGHIAQQKGLVDVLGGLHTAVATAAKAAGIQSPYKVSIWSTQFESVWSGLDQYVRQALWASVPGHLQLLAGPSKVLRDLVSMRGLQARMPYDMTIE